MTWPKHKKDLVLECHVNIILNSNHKLLYNNSLANAAKLSLSIFVDSISLFSRTSKTDTKPQSICLGHYAE